MSQKTILLLIVPAFILVVAWIIFSIYHNAVKSTIPENLNIQIFPIAPVFDAQTIEKIKNRKIIIPLYESSGSSASQPADLLQVEVEASPSANATEGGILTP